MLKAASAFACLLLVGCSTARKTVPELSRLEGKRVALIEVDGEATSRDVVEVALVNQIIRRGTFELVGKKDVDTARAAPDQATNDFKGIAKRAGADYALRAKVLEFDAKEREGYDETVVEDSQMAVERGENDRYPKRLYKVKSLTAKVRVSLEFTNLNDGEMREAVAQHEQAVSSGTQDKAARLPPRLGFLEKTANEAFRLFFDQYN